MAQLGNNVRAFRLAAGMTQAELAERIGRDHSFVSKIESEKKGTSDETKLAICKALGQPLQRVFYQEPAEQVAAS